MPISKNVECEDFLSSHEDMLIHSPVANREQAPSLDLSMAKSKADLGVGARNYKA